MDDIKGKIIMGLLVFLGFKVNDKIKERLINNQPISDLSKEIKREKHEFNSKISKLSKIKNNGL